MTENNELKSMWNETVVTYRVTCLGGQKKTTKKAQHNEHLPITIQNHCILHQFARLHVKLHLRICIILLANGGMVEKLRRPSTLPLKNLWDSRLGGPQTPYGHSGAYNPNPPV
jgi:hypothetical protein